MLSINPGDMTRLLEMQDANSRVTDINKKIGNASRLILTIIVFIVLIGIIINQARKLRDTVGESFTILRPEPSGISEE